MFTRAVSTAIAIALSCAFAPAAGAADPKCDAAPEGTCEHVTVPLDRSQPGGATIDIAYVVFRHSDASKPTAGTIFVTEGGPGFSALNSSQGGYRSVFGPLLGDHDLVLIDQRGVGRSGAIDCKTLQSAGGDLYEGAKQCAAQLGDAAYAYGSADVARDIDAVRAALGVEKIDFYGGSFAGMDIQAYAARFPQHLRSVELDSPAVLSAGGPFNPLMAPQLAAVVKRVCGRSATCSAANRNPSASLRALIKRLRAKPVTGVGRDASGGKHHLTVTEARLARMLQSDSGGFAVQGEIPAAWSALRRGDSAPLLRLAAENDSSIFEGDGSPAENFSVGDNIARYCADQAFQWDKSASEADRRNQFAAARAALAPDAFAPFSVDAWVQPPPFGILPDPCIGWPAPKHALEPPVPAGTVTQGVPALIVTGDLDLSVAPAESAQAARQFPQSTLVSLESSGHHTVFNARHECSAELINRFVKQLDAGDTGCAKKPAIVFPAQGGFPRHAGASRAQVARVTTATVLDVLKRTFVGADPRGVGLRGGSFTVKFSDNGLTARLHGVRFARDLAVSGKIDYVGYTKIDAKLKVRGGTLHVRGVWASDGATKLRISGKLRGRKVALSVPAT
jgi:pimeloyl-ACP methyl ester carboxylesterase